MPTYEMRLTNKRGKTTLVYNVECADDQQAREKILTLEDIHYVRYEIWRGMDLLAEGPQFIVH